MADFNERQKRILDEVNAKISGAGKAVSQPPAAPKPGVFQQFMADLKTPNPTTDYGIAFPVARDEGGDKRLGASKLMQGVYDTVMGGGEAARGMRDPEGPARDMAALMVGAPGVKAAPQAIKQAVGGAAELMGARPIGEMIAGGAAKVNDMAAGTKAGLLGDYGTQAGRSAARAAKRDNMTANMLEAKLAELGPAGTLADTGPNMFALAETAAQRPGKALTEGSSMLKARQMGQGERLMGTLDKRMDSRDFGGTYDSLEKGRSALGSPAYEQLYAKYPVIQSKYLDNLIKQEPDITQALKETSALERMAASERGEAFDPKTIGVTAFNEAGDPVLGPQQSLRQWNSIKMGLDSIIKAGGAKIYNEQRDFTPYGRSLNKIRKGLVRELDNLAPEYKETRALWAGPSRSMEMMDEGMEFIKRGKSSLDVDEIKGMSQADKDFMRVGAKQQLKDLVENTPDGSDAVKKIFGTKSMRNKIEALFPDADEFKLLERDFSGEESMFETGKNMANSRTKFRQAAEADEGGGPSLGMLGNLMRGRLGAAAGQALEPVVGRLMGPPQGRADELAAMFTTDRAGQQKLLQAIREAEASGLPKPSRLSQDLARTLGGPNQ